MNSNTNRVEFNESKMGYLFFLVIFLIIIVGSFVFLYLIGSTLYLALGAVFLPFYTIALLNRLLYKWKFNPILHLIPVISLVLGAIGGMSGVDPFNIVFALMINVMALLIAVPFASFTYTMNCEYNKETGNLSIYYNKLYLQTKLEYNIPHGEALYLYIIERPTLIRNGMFHSIALDKGKRIPIASMSANGFGLIGKVYQLFEPVDLNINQIPKTNSKIIFPPIKRVLLTLPKKGKPPGYYPIELLPKVLEMPSYKKLFPQKNQSAIIKPIVLLMIFFGVPVMITYLIIQSFLGNIEAAPTEMLVYLILLTGIIIIVGIIVGANFLAVVVGKQEFEVTEDSFLIKYKIKGKTVERKIHKAFNPLVRIDKNKIDLIILSNDMQLFYEHRMGKFEETELPILLSTLNMPEIIPPTS